MERSEQPIAVLISIQPRWCSLILAGDKTAELRKTFPLSRRLFTPFPCYIYETTGPTDMPWCDEDGHTIYRGRGAVIGRFTCRSADSLYESLGTLVVSHRLCDPCFSEKPLDDYCLTEEQALDYLGGKVGYGWRISGLETYERPLPITAFGVKRAPQSWGYIYSEPGGTAYV